MNRRIILISVAVFIGGALIGLAASPFLPAGNRKQSSTASSSDVVRVDSPDYKFINPRLYANDARSTQPAYLAFQFSVSSYINQAENSGQADSVSVYFRDLNYDQWIGVNENEDYTPSSMLKVIAMMAVLKLGEQDPSILNKKLYYNKPKQGNQYYNAGDDVTDGYYTVQDLIGFMIRDSDNDAFNAIISDKQINAEFVNVYTLFRFPQTALEGTTTDFLSPKLFSSIFRSFYNSSFFGWNLSEQVLGLLSQTTFTQGLVAGVPEGTLVSHKFGENTDQLHDCGIIYYPDHPYLLCVMTRGKDISSLENVISSLSRQTWNFINTQYAPNL